MPQDNIKNIQIANEVLIPEIINLLHEGHTVTLKVKGYSMRPFLEHERDKVKLASKTDWQINDVVLAEIAPKRYVLHRLIALDGDKVTLLGDGNLATEHCSISDLHGVAVAFFRKDREKADSCDGKKWKVYSWIWMRLRPIRRYLLFLYRIYRRLCVLKKDSI